MARAEKQTALTMEERLEKALVPDWEQPYKVPENWVWTRAGIISELNPPKQQPEDLETKITFVPMAAVSEVSGSIETPEIRPAKSVVKGFTSFREGDVIFAKITPCMENGKVAIAENLENGFGYGSTEFFVFRPSNAINKKILYYFLRNPAFRDEAKQNMSGAVGQQRVSKEFLSQHAFPLPPLAEQQRIVNRIESLFSKLDEAKEKTQAVLDSFGTRKAAILHKAFAGELTSQWRKENGMEMENWKIVKVKSILSGIKYGTSEKSDYNYGGLPVLRIPNIGEGVLNFKDIKYLQSKEMPEEDLLHSGDILVIRSNGSKELVGKCAYVPELDQQYAYASFLIRLRLNNQVDPHYMVHFLSSTDARNQLFEKAKSSAGINNINSKEIGDVNIPVPLIEEQQEIVRYLNAFFAKEQQVQEVVVVTLGQINLIKKSILARAFRGELGTNDPAEESALELLKQCFVQQANEQEQAPKKKRAPAVVLSDEVR